MRVGLRAAAERKRVAGTLIELVDADAREETARMLSSTMGAAALERVVLECRRVGMHSWLAGHRLLMQAPPAP